MWIAAILIFIVLFDLSALVQYVTRFTEEGFALLISLIFVFEAFEKLIHVMKHHPIHFYDTPVTDQCSGVCASPYWNDSHVVYWNDSHVVNDTDDWVENFTDVWSNKSLQDCVLDGGNWTVPVVDIHKQEPEVFFMSVILFFGTFSMAMTLKGMKSKPYFPSQVYSMETYGV
jgi:ABC-type multidrug transport system fused ATPase/permease subunit